MREPGSGDQAWNGRRFRSQVLSDNVRVAGSPAQWVGFLTHMEHRESQNRQLEGPVGLRLGRFFACRAAVLRLARTRMPGPLGACATLSK
jgi:hypothetical protein